MKQSVASSLKQSGGLPDASALTVAIINRGSFKLPPIGKCATNVPIALGSLQLQPKRHSTLLTAIVYLAVGDVSDHQFQQEAGFHHFSPVDRHHSTDSMESRPYGQKNDGFITFRCTPIERSG